MTRGCFTSHLPLDKRAILVHPMTMTHSHENNISITPNRLDWKFTLVLALHLLAVGAMYGSITSKVSSTEAVVNKIELKLDDMKRSVDDTRLDVAGLKEVKTRLDRLEGSLWQLKNSKP